MNSIELHFFCAFDFLCKYVRFLLCCTTHFLLLEHSILVLSLFTRRAVRSAFKRCNKERRDKNSNLWPNSPVWISQYSLWVVNDLAQYYTYWVSLFSHAGVSLFLMPALATWCYVVRSAIVHNMTIGLSLKILAIQADLSCVWRISNYLRELLYRLCQDHCTPSFHDPVL